MSVEHLCSRNVGYSEAYCMYRKSSSDIPTKYYNYTMKETFKLFCCYLHLHALHDVMFVVAFFTFFFSSFFVVVYELWMDAVVDNNKKRRIEEKQLSIIFDGDRQIENIFFLFFFWFYSDKTVFFASFIFGSMSFVCFPFELLSCY